MQELDFDVKIEVKRDSILVSYIKDRVYNSPKNVIIVIVGEPGTGKSNLGIALLHKLNPELFEEMTPEEVLEKRLAFNPTRFLEIINDPETKKGSVVVFDEPQINFNSRDFYSTTNKMINKVLTTFRHRQLITIFCTPSLSYIDSQARKLMSLFIEPYNMNMKEGYIKARVYKYQYNAYMDKVFRPKIRFQDPNDRTLKVLSTISVRRLPPRIERAYKEVSHKFKRDITKDVQKKLKGEIDSLKEKPVLTMLEKEVIKLKVNKKKNKEEMAEELGLPKAQINKVYKDLKKKGLGVNKAVLEMVN